jgi:hypothetical protein
MLASWDGIACQHVLWSAFGRSPCSQEARIAQSVICDAGIRNVLMCYNTELRKLYDVYAAKDIRWYHSGSYTRKTEMRPCHGLLSLQVWQMVLDSDLTTEDMPMLQVNEALAEACAAPKEISVRRKRVAMTGHAPGVWTFQVPLNSPFRVRICASPQCPALLYACMVHLSTWTSGPVDLASMHWHGVMLSGANATLLWRVIPHFKLRPCLQEMTYPEFCESLVRLSQLRFCSMPRLEARLHSLVTCHLLQLLKPDPPYHAISAFMSTALFAQYFESIDPVLRITFAASCNIVVRSHLNHSTVAMSQTT